VAQIGKVTFNIVDAGTGAFTPTEATKIRTLIESINAQLLSDLTLAGTVPLAAPRLPQPSAR
jgi:hypothetical protein